MSDDSFDFDDFLGESDPDDFGLADCVEESLDSSEDGAEMEVVEEEDRSDDWDDEEDSD